jgi:hypothetical protein
MRDFNDTIPVMTAKEADDGIIHSWHLHRVHAPHHDYSVHTAEVSDDAANDDDPKAGMGAVVVPLLIAGCVAAFLLLVLVTGKHA